jgi:hypothetical protein
MRWPEWVETAIDDPLLGVSALRPIRSPSRTGRHPKTDIDPRPSSATKGGLQTFGRRWPGQNHNGLPVTFGG